MTSVTVQEKWNNLRTYFSRQLKKQRNVCSGMSSDDVFNSKWEHFQSMMFLKETFIPRTSISNLPLEKADQLNSEDVLLRNYIADKENTYNLYDERNFPVYNTETEDEVSVFEINEEPNIDMFSSSTPISNSSDIHTDHNYPKKINFANKSTIENEPYHFPVFQTIPTKRNILNNSSSNIDVIRSPSISNSSDIRTDHNSNKSTTQNESYNIPIYKNARKPIKKNILNNTSSNIDEKIKRRRRTTSDDQNIEALKTATAALKDICQNKSPDAEGEEDAYGRVIARQMLKLPIKQRENLRLKYQKLYIEALEELE